VKKKIKMMILSRIVSIRVSMIVTHLNILMLNRIISRVIILKLRASNLITPQSRML
jgi:hypothetical protein